MKNLIDYINEGILGDVDDVLANGDTDIAELMIMDIINAVYKLKAKTKLDIIPTKNDNGKYTVNATGDVAVKDRSIKTLVNDVFEWGEVDGEFSVWKCANLTDLVGSPKKVLKSFNANQCSKLKSLAGMPEIVGSFYCQSTSIKTLEGSPKYVIGDFDCSYNYSLESTVGAPLSVGGDFRVSNCGILKVLQDMPNEIGGDFSCRNCHAIKNIVNVPKKIYGTCYVPKHIYDEAVEKLEPVCIQPRTFKPDDRRVIATNK